MCARCRSVEHGNARSARRDDSSSCTRSARGSSRFRPAMEVRRCSPAAASGFRSVDSRLSRNPSGARSRCISRNRPRLDTRRCSAFAGCPIEACRSVATVACVRSDVFVGGFRWACGLAGSVARKPAGPHVCVTWLSTCQFVSPRECVGVSNSVSGARVLECSTATISLVCSRIQPIQSCRTTTQDPCV